MAMTVFMVEFLRRYDTLNPEIVIIEYYTHNHPLLTLS